MDNQLASFANAKKSHTQSYSKKKKKWPALLQSSTSMKSIRATFNLKT